MSAPEALAAAQRELMRDKRFGNPYYWAAYQIGGADEFVNSPRKVTSVSPPHLKGTFLSLYREDYATLAQAFLYAGARAVASTLWRIDDRTKPGGRPYYINRNHTLVNRRGNDVFFDLPIIEVDLATIYPNHPQEALMRALKRHRNVFLSTLALATMVAAACKPDLPTEVAQADPTVAYARPSSPGYTSANLGVLTGDNSSRANGVNDAGEVVGYSCCSPGSRGFVTLGGVLTALAGTSGNALAISNGTTRYVVGWAGATSLPVRWSITGSTPSQPTTFGLGAATWGAAQGVNDDGEAVGHAGIDAAMWDVGGNLTLVSAPAGFVRGEGRDINNAGHAVFAFSRSDAGWPNGIAIGYLRLASGDTVRLPPVAADVISYANSVSSVTNGLVDVAGSSYSAPSSSRAVRWTVDIVTKQIVGTDVRPEASHAVAISDGRAAAGFLEAQTNSLRTTAFRWQGSALLSLNPPKSAKEGKAWAISPNGLLIAGEAIVQLSRRAILWTFPSP